MEPITITLPSWSQISSYFTPPDSTDDVIIYPYSSGSKKFPRTVDSTKVTQGKVSKDDVNDVVTIFEIVFGRVSSSTRFLAGLFFSFLFPFMLVVNNSWFDWRFTETVRLFYLIFYFIASTYSVYKRMRETGRRKVDVQRMIEMIRPAYAKRGLTWHFSENFFCSWLELKKVSSVEEQNSSLSVEVHSDNNQERFINQQDSIGKIFEDGENIIVCAGKNLTGPDFSPPVQFRYVISFIIYGFYMLALIFDQYSYVNRISNRYYYY